MYRAPRGTNDILPEEQAYWRYIEKQVENICMLYGYGRIDTPVFEDTNLFIRSVGEETDIVAKQMYTFGDKSGSQLTLRPEGTAPVCRAYIEHGLHNQTQPVKLYYLAPIFRYERPQAGRYRQHHQFGYEAIGDKEPALDAEVIDMAWQFFHSMGLSKLSIKLNSIGCKKCRPNYLKALIDYYSKYVEELCADCKVRLKINPLRLLDCKRPSCQQIADSAPHGIDYLCHECSEHFQKVQRYLQILDIKYILDHRLVRGLDYYTKTVFEIQPVAGGGQSAIGGGGRYDDLIEELGGKHTPAIGFATGIERIIRNLKEQDVYVHSKEKIKVLIAYTADEAREKVIQMASELRRDGISVIITVSGKSLKAQLRQANAIGTQYTVIVDENEARSGNIILRDMAKAEQTLVSFNEMRKLLK